MRGMGRFRDALGLLWYYQALIIVLWAASVYLAIVIADQVSVLDELEPVIEKVSEAQMSKQTAYEARLDDVVVSMRLDQSDLPVRDPLDLAAKGQIVHSRRCQCFTHSNPNAMDYHITALKAVEQHSLNAEHVQNAVQELPEIQARDLRHKSAQLRPLRSVSALSGRSVPIVAGGGGVHPR
jgi:hypothetical protein